MPAPAIMTRLSSKSWDMLHIRADFWRSEGRRAALEEVGKGTVVSGIEEKEEVGIELTFELCRIQP